MLTLQRAGSSISLILRRRADSSPRLFRLKDSLEHGEAVVSLACNNSSFRISSLGCIFNPAPWAMLLTPVVRHTSTPLDAYFCGPETVKSPKDSAISIMAPKPCCDLASYTAPGKILSSHSKRLVGQTVLVGGFKGLASLSEVKALVEESACGGIVLTTNNLPNGTQALHTTHKFQEAGRSIGHPYPLLIGIEQEGGLVSRGFDVVQLSHFPSPLALAAGRSVPTLEAVGGAIGKELCAVGVNWFIAPVVDLVADLVEPLDVSRRFGSDAENVGNNIGAFIKGLNGAGVISCATEALTRSLREAYRQTLEDGDIEDFSESVRDELYPLQHLLNLGRLDCVMLSSNIWDLENTKRMSRSVQYVIDCILRAHLNYEGPVIMNCASLPLDLDVCSIHVPLRALLAGSDMVCISGDRNSQLASINAIHAAFERDASFRSAITRSSNRVVSMKSQYLAWPAPTTTMSPNILPSLLPAHGHLASTAYRASITALQATPSPLLSLSSSSVVLLLTPTVPHIDDHGGELDPFEPLGQALSSSQPRIRHVPYRLSAGLTPTHLAFLSRAAAVILVLACTSSALTEAQLEVCFNVETVLAGVEEKSEQEIGRIVVSAGDVQDIFQANMLEKRWWGVACWDYTRGALVAVADVISGQKEATGNLPVAVRR